jgi:hypothetical protein
MDAGASEAELSPLMMKCHSWLESPSLQPLKAATLPAEMVPANACKGD